MRFLKTFFRFFTIVTLCTTFTTVAWGYAWENLSTSPNCNHNTVTDCVEVPGCAYYPVANKCGESLCDDGTKLACNKKAGCIWITGTDEKNCQVVPDGYFSPDGDKTWNGIDYDRAHHYGCPAGYYCKAGSGWPIICSAGTYSGANASSCSNCTTGNTSSAGSSSCTGCTNGPTGSTYFGYAANAGGSCPWRLNKCAINQYFNTSTKSCTNCGANKHNYLWTTTSATNLCWDGKTNSSTVYLCNNSNAQVSFPTGFDSSDIFNCESNKYTIKVYIQYNGNTSYVSEFTYVATNGGQVTTESNHYIADPVNSYISKSLQNKYTLNSTKYYLYKYVADIANNNHIGSYLNLQGNTLYLDNSSNVQELPDGTTLYALVPLTGAEYKVYMISSGYNNGSPNPMFSADTVIATKQFGSTPSDGVTPELNKVQTCSFGNGTTTYYGYIASGTTPKYYECEKDITHFNLISNSNNGSTNMFEPSKNGYDICIGYAMTTCEAGYSCNSCERTACAKGKYQDATGQSSCKDCVAGKKTGVDGTGATSCTACDKGTYSNGTANASCTACAAGKYQDATGQSSCKDCVAGKKTGVNGTGATSCTVCDKGTYSNGTANALCTSCDVGKYQDTTGQTSCKPCSTGTYQDTTGQYSCKSCSTQTSSKYPSSASGSDSISDCYLTLTDGKYVPTAGGGAQNCPAGSYCSKSGTKVYHSTNTPTTVAVSGQCVKGEYSTGGASMCSPCQEGYATGINGTGATTCTACPAGTYSDDAVNYECDPCPAGSHQNEAGQSTCDTCSAGTYSAAGMSDCVECPIGTYQNKSGQSSCISCQDEQESATTESSGLFTTANTGTETRKECYLNPDLKLTDSISNASGVKLNTLPGYGNKIYYVGSGSQK